VLLMSEEKMNRRGWLSLLMVGLLSVTAACEKTEETKPETAKTPEKAEESKGSMPTPAVDDAQEPLLTDAERDAKEPTTSEVLAPGTETAPGWTVVDKASLTEGQVAQLERAETAKKTLGTKLKERVSKEIAEKGLAESVDVCGCAAPPITQGVAREFGVEIGRTSFKLRNTDNKAPVWMEPIRALRTDVPHLVAGPDGALGVTSPIWVEDGCLKCHGPRAGLEPGVKEVLDGRFQEDRATGFEAGDLRGYFWVQVPALAAAK